MKNIILVLILLILIAGCAEVSPEKSSKTYDNQSKSTIVGQIPNYDNHSNKISNGEEKLPLTHLEKEIDYVLEKKSVTKIQYDELKGSLTSITNISDEARKRMGQKLKQLSKYVTEKPKSLTKDFKLILPVKKEEVTFKLYGIWPFGVKGGDHPEGHPGIDLEAKDGTPVRAMADGKVSKPADSGHYDYETINVFHENNFETYYTGNMKNFVFKAGGRVKAGDIIAYYDGDESIHYGLQQKVPYWSVCPVNYMAEQAKKDLEELFKKATYPEQKEYPLLCNPCPKTGCK